MFSPKLNYCTPLCHACIERSRKDCGGGTASVSADEPHAGSYSAHPRTTADTSANACRDAYRQTHSRKGPWRTERHPAKQVSHSVMVQNPTLTCNYRAAGDDGRQNSLTVGPIGYFSQSVCTDQPVHPTSTPLLGTSSSAAPSTEAGLRSWKLPVAALPELLRDDMRCLLPIDNASTFLEQAAPGAPQAPRALRTRAPATEPRPWPQPVRTVSCASVQSFGSWSYGARLRVAQAGLACQP